MRDFSSRFVAWKNSQEIEGGWCQLIDLTLPGSMVYLTSNPETITYMGNIYCPFPISIDEERTSGDGQLPSIGLRTSNYGGLAYKFVKENDLTLQEVTIRLINTLSSSGDEYKARYWIRSVVFANEIASFELGFPFSYEEEGPRRTWNRRDHPGIPLNLRAYSFIA